MATIRRTVEDRGQWVGGTPGHFVTTPKGREWIPGTDPVWVSKPTVVKEQVLTPRKCRTSKRVKQVKQFTNDPQIFGGTYRSGFATR